MAQNYVLLERIELNASATSVTFSNIPQSGYTDLKIVYSGRNTSTSQWVALNFNGLTSSFTGRYLQGDGTTAASGTQANANNFALLDTSNNTANTFSSVDIYIPQYTSSSFKSVSIDMVQEDNATAANSRLTSFLWSNTAAITSIGFSAIGGTSLAQYSTFSLYGIAAVGTTPAIAPKADGGNVIATDGTYWYHAFLSNGTFTPQVGLSADVLVVAGGGAGGTGGSLGGGGGAGGLLAYTSQSLASSTGYACTIGAGGSGAIFTGTKPTQGISSQFASLTAAIGGGRGGGTSSTGGFSDATYGPGGSGGSGGGGMGYYTPNGGGTGSQGSNGGSGSSGAFGCGGGGGYSATGSNGSGNNGGAGGNGSSAYSSWLSAMSLGQNVSGTYYIAGGGGGAGTSAAGAGGYGGASSGTTGAVSSAGTANTGGGSGGTYEANTGNGGSGIIIIRYAV